MPNGIINFANINLVEFSHKLALSVKGLLDHISDEEVYIIFFFTDDNTTVYQIRGLDINDGDSGDDGDDGDGGDDDGGIV